MIDLTWMALKIELLHVFAMAARQFDFTSKLVEFGNLITFIRSVFHITELHVFMKWMWTLHLAIYETACTYIVAHQ